MNKLTKEQEIILRLFKDFLMPYNSRSISKFVGISHAGAFKIFKKLEKREIVKATQIGKANIYSLNSENPLTPREIEIALIIESQNHRKWLEEFKILKEKAIFVILFGSIIKNEKTARDIDLLVVADKTEFKNIKRIINQKNKLLNKKIHLIPQTLEDFKHDVLSRNKAIMDIIETGIVLFGQDKLREVLLK